MLLFNDHAIMAKFTHMPDTLRWKKFDHHYTLSKY